ncbi:fluoride efflux transporter FluC [Levilactobacillus bambusae]|uniref:Fluoride-specific ion channel FluC n=1 Tax=Levilactobacillus bambusae TaxID=2024736 RepID=A0A2V1MWJ9_9LACO|nr:CrcB family protein [Levilactobacillus bambusae]PWF99473.1 chromosome condensation protein CrcB [Levilactobacillus bambusae]
MRKFISVAAFAFVGGALREALTLIPLVGDHYWLICTINLLGCFLLAFVTEGLPAILPLSDVWLTGLSTGLIGSFTTFSTFSTDFYILLRTNQFSWAILYVMVSLFGGLTCAYLGVRLSNRIIHKKEGGL